MFFSRRRFGYLIWSGSEGNKFQRLMALTKPDNDWKRTSAWGTPCYL